MKHNMSNSRLYKIYMGMKGRCYNPNESHYERYGKRGITVCDEWLNDFMKFYDWSMENGYEDDLTIDRIDVGGNYCPENCRWITASENASRANRNNPNINFNFPDDADDNIKGKADRRVYPVIFTQTQEGFLIEVPDLEILTEGTDMENAIDMARDAISITLVSMEENNEAVPTPSAMEKIDITKGTFAENGKGFVSLVDTNIEEYRRKVDTAPVRRNVSLPSWLNHEVNAAGINVSRVLQDALMEKLNIERRI